MKVAAVAAILFSASVILIAIFARGGDGSTPAGNGVVPTEGPGAGQGPPQPVEEPAGKDPATGIEWRKFTLQGVTVLIPGDGGKDWLINLNYDSCDPLKAQYFVVEHVPSAIRFRVDLQTQSIRFRGTPPAAVQAVTDTIQRSFAGRFTGDPRLRGTPRPIPLDCGTQPSDDIPPIQRAFEPPDRPPESTITPEPTSTPAPAPTPVFVKPTPALAN